MNNKIRYIVFIIFIVFGMINVSLLWSENLKCNISGIKVSSSTDPSTPWMNLTDGDIQTAWGFVTGSATGWAEITLESETRIYGVVLSAQLSSETSLSIEFEQNGMWHYFSGGCMKGSYVNDTFVDLSFDNVVISKIALRLNGVDLGSSCRHPLYFPSQTRDIFLIKYPC